MSDQDHRARPSRQGNTICRTALLTTAAAGTVHGVFSLYWSMGGDWLLESLGADLIETFADSRWLLPVGLAKIFAAVFPLLLARWAWPVPRLSRSACWVGAIVLVLWGGATGGHASSRMSRAARHAMAMIGAFRLPETMVGSTDASTTLRWDTPRTRNRESTTSSWFGPIAAVPTA